MSDITCGQCVCPVLPVETISPTDLCQPINATYGICHMSGGFPSWQGAFLSGIIITIFVSIFIFIIYNLFFGGYSEVKKK